MTYKEVIDDLLDIFKRHKMIQTWGYGNLTDLVSPFKKLDATGAASPTQDVYNVDYPYAFLQPLSHSLQKGKSTFNFNLIMMEQCNDEHLDVIQAQSNCYQYIQDVLAEIYYNYDQKFDFTLNSTVNPFREKYNDTVSGMTANISIQIPMILDDCIAPFKGKPIVYSEIVSVEEINSQTVDPDAGVSFGDVFRFANDISDPNMEWSIYQFDPSANGTYKFVMTYSFQFENVPGVTAPPILSIRQTGIPVVSVNAVTTGWPAVPSTGVTYNITQVWEGVLLTTANTVFMQYYNTPANEIALLVDAGAGLKIYKAE